MLGHANGLTLPTCVTAKGQHVTYVASRDEVWINGFSIAFAQTRFHIPIIFYDPIALAEAPKDFQIWLMYHECYHVGKPPQFEQRGYSPMHQTAEERLADKYATIKAVNRGLHLETIYNTIRDVDFYTRNTPPDILERDAKAGRSIAHELNRRGDYFKRTAKMKILRGH